MKVRLVTASNHDLALREIAYMLRGITEEAELYNLNQQAILYNENTLRNIIEKLAEDPAEIYLFTVRELDRLRAYQVSDKLREMGLTTVAGGTYAFSNTGECRKHFDTIVIGDAKNALNEILQGRKGILSCGLTEPEIESYDVPLFYLENGIIIRSKSGIKPLNHPQYKNRTEMSFTTMRGCSGSCSYCEVSQLRKKFPDYRIRKKQIEDVLSYVKEKSYKIRPDYTYIWDEDFLLHSDKEIETFAKIYADIKIPFFIFATPLTVISGKSKLEKLAEAGLNQVNIGIQSGSERIQKALFGRKETLDEGKRAASILAGIYKKHPDTMQPPMIDFITLNPYETERDIIESISYVLNLPKPFDLIVHIMNFFEGTPLKYDALKNGLIDKNYSFDYDLHDFVSHAKDSLKGRRKNNAPEIYLSSVLFRMRGVHDGDRCGMINRCDVDFLLSDNARNYWSGNICKLIEEMDKKYNAMNL